MTVNVSSSDDSHTKLTLHQVHALCHNAKEIFIIKPLRTSSRKFMFHLAVVVCNARQFGINISNLGVASEI